MTPLSLSSICFKMGTLFHPAPLPPRSCRRSDDVKPSANPTPASQTPSARGGPAAAAVKPHRSADDGDDEETASADEGEGAGTADASDPLTRAVALGATVAPLGRVLASSEVAPSKGGGPPAKIAAAVGGGGGASGEAAVLRSPAAAGKPSVKAKAKKAVPKQPAAGGGRAASLPLGGSVTVAGGNTTAYAEWMMQQVLPLDILPSSVSPQSPPNGCLLAPIASGRRGDGQGLGCGGAAHTGGGLQD